MELGTQECWLMQHEVPPWMQQVYFLVWWDAGWKSQAAAPQFGLMGCRVKIRDIVMSSMWYELMELRVEADPEQPQEGWFSKGNAERLRNIFFQLDQDMNGHLSKHEFCSWVNCLCDLLESVCMLGGQVSGSCIPQLHNIVHPKQENKSSFSISVLRKHSCL